MLHSLYTNHPHVLLTIVVIGLLAVLAVVAAAITIVALVVLDVRHNAQVKLEQAKRRGTYP